MKPTTTKGGAGVEKQTKNVITREWIKQELLFHTGADFKYLLVGFCVMLVLCLPLMVGAVYAILLSPRSLILKLIQTFLGICVSSFPIWVMLAAVRGVLSERKRVMDGNFSVVIREVLYKCEKPVRGRRIAEFLGFDDFEDVSVGHTEYQLAARGDRYYLVCCGKKKEIRLIYACNRYELKD